MATFTNQATLTYNGVTTNSNIATGELVEVLAVTKTALQDNYSANSTVTFVVNLTNSGNTAQSDLTVTDNLGGYVYDAQTVYPLTYTPDSVRLFVNGVLQAAPAVQAGPPMTVTGLTIPAGGNATLIYQTTANSFAPPEVGENVVNRVDVSGLGRNAVTSAVATVAASDTPELTIGKSITPTTVTENSPITYTFTVSNYGSAPATVGDNAAVTDTFNPVLRDLAVAFNGVAWAAGTNYNYNAGTGEFATVPGQITVPAATYTRAADGSWSITPGVSTLTVTGTI